MSDRAHLPKASQRSRMLDSRPDDVITVTIRRADLSTLHAALEIATDAPSVAQEAIGTARRMDFLKAVIRLRDAFLTAGKQKLIESAVEKATADLRAGNDEVIVDRDCLAKEFAGARAEIERMREFIDRTSGNYDADLVIGGLVADKHKLAADVERLTKDRDEAREQLASMERAIAGHS